MKKITISVTAALLLLVSCTLSNDSIRDEASAYLNATATYDVDEACKHCTTETAKGLEAVKEVILPQLDSSYLNQNKQATITILDIERVNDTTAKVVYSKKTPLTQYVDTLKMVQRDGAWMAHMPIAIPPIVKKSNHVYHYDTTAVYTQGE